MPTLIVNGDEDEPCLGAGLFLKRQIPGARLLVLPDTGHTINLEEPAAFNRAVLDFLTLVEPVGGPSRIRLGSLQANGRAPSNRRPETTTGGRDPSQIAPPDDHRRACSSRWCSPPFSRVRPFSGRLLLVLVLVRLLLFDLLRHDDAVARGRLDHVAVGRVVVQRGGHFLAARDLDLDEVPPGSPSAHPLSRCAPLTPRVE